MMQDRKPQRRKPRAQKERGGDKVERRKLKLKSTSNKLFPVGKRGGSPHVTGSGLEGERKRFQRQEI